MNGDRTQPASQALKDGPTYITDDKAKAETFAKQYAKISSTDNYSSNFKNNKKAAEQQLQYLTANDAPDTELNLSLNVDFSIWELQTAIKRAKKGIALGAYKIATDFLVHLPESTLNILLKLCNKIWNDGHIPQQWKNAIVIPILKKRKRRRKSGIV